MSSIYGSAAGANVMFNQNNASVAFGGTPAPASTTTYTTPSYDNPPQAISLYDNPSGGEASMVGNTCDSTEFNGKTIQSVSFQFKKSGSPSGNIKAELWDNSSPPQKQGTFGTVSMPTLSTSSYTEITFPEEGSADLEFTDGWRIICNSGNESDSSNFIRLGYDSDDGSTQASTAFAQQDSGVPYTCSSNCSGGCVTPDLNDFCEQSNDQTAMKVVYED